MELSVQLNQNVKGIYYVGIYKKVTHFLLISFQTSGC